MQIYILFLTNQNRATSIVTRLICLECYNSGEESYKEQYISGTLKCLANQPNGNKAKKETDDKCDKVAPIFKHSQPSVKVVVGVKVIDPDVTKCLRCPFAVACRAELRKGYSPPLSVGRKARQELRLFLCSPNQRQPFA